ncbi:MAG: selenium-dependent molybdenum cofactor biosynthesis protein YqeB [Anaerolineae bacterium]
MFEDMLVVIKGGGDLATGVAYRLHKVGFPVVITELPQPLVVRRTAAFASAVFEGRAEIEGVVARLVQDMEQVLKRLSLDEIPVVIDPEARIIAALHPYVVVDAIMAKRNTGTTINDAPIVIGLGPGFTAEEDVHAVVETNRGHNLGRVYLWGKAEADTGVPGDIEGFTEERVLHAPCDGIFSAERHIGEWVTENQVIGYVDIMPVLSSISGLIRGLLADGVAVREGAKLGDIDPRCEVEHCYTISDKARAVGGGVLEAILYLHRQRQQK